MPEDNRKLYRQVHPQWFIDNRLWSVALKPTPKDNGFLSVYNGEIFTPKESYEHYTKSGLKSACVVSVTVKNCTDLGLNVIDDNIPFHGHSSIDFNSVQSDNKRKKKAESLREKAKIEYNP